VEVREIMVQNDGRDPYPKMLKREKLPKQPMFTYCPGMKMKKDVYYGPKDLLIGSHVKVFGRDCYIYGCNGYTKQWYKDNLGIDMESVNLEKDKPVLKYQEIPPYLGYGSAEDSMGSVNSLMPKAPQPNVQKIFKNDLHILRFEAKLVSSNADDDSRKFILSFFCGDDTIQVYEVAERNSGRLPGKFLDKQRHINPVTGSYYSEKDMLLGELLLLGGHKFRLMKCDEYTEKYYEANPEVFKEASIDYVLQKIRTLGKGFPSIEEYSKDLMGKMDKNKDNYLSFDEFCAGLKALGIILTYQEQHTLMRRFDKNQDNRISLQEFIETLTHG
jgi:hypothetical protein